MAVKEKHKQKNKIIETERLYLRELAPEDRDELAKILCDPESMKYYPAPFTREKVENWIEWNRRNYREFGHCLWAVILKKGDLFLGDCGLTMQEIEGALLPELGYHMKKEHGGKGYATEAAAACIRYGLARFPYPALYTYTKHDNLPSIRVAEKNGMGFVKHFAKEIDGESVREALYRLPAKKVLLMNLCYTDLVYGRINKKLKKDLSDSDTEQFIHRIIEETPEESITKTGKNWYVRNEREKTAVTINSRTCRVITADRL